METILARLQEAYGRPRNTHRLEPLDELVLTVLSQNTNDNNRDRAYAAPRARYPTWEEVLQATDAAVAHTIRGGGLSNQKSKRIRAILGRIQQDHGRLDLDCLRRWPVARAAEYLGSFQGVGEKTICCVLLFSLGKAAFPVDTHIHRLARRLGFVADKADAAEAHRVMGALIPPKDYYPVHMNLIRHGRQVCHARRPDCGACVVARSCPSRVRGDA